MVYAAHKGTADYFAIREWQDYNNIFPLKELLQQDMLGQKGRTELVRILEMYFWLDRDKKPPLVPKVREKPQQPERWAHFVEWRMDVYGENVTKAVKAVAEQWGLNERGLWDKIKGLIPLNK